MFTLRTDLKRGVCTWCSQRCWRIETIYKSVLSRGTRFCGRILNSPGCSFARLLCTLTLSTCIRAHGRKPDSLGVLLQLLPRTSNHPIHIHFHVHISDNLVGRLMQPTCTSNGSTDTLSREGKLDSLDGHLLPRGRTFCSSRGSHG